MVELERLSKVETLKTEPLEFFRQVLGVESTDYKKELVCGCQVELIVGKSFTASGLLLNHALTNAGIYIGVVGPSWRQTKLVIRRIGDFERRLPHSSKIIIQKTRITCPTRISVSESSS